MVNAANAANTAPTLYVKPGDTVESGQRYSRQGYAIGKGMTTHITAQPRGVAK